MTGGQCILDAKVYISGFEEFLHLDQLRNKWEGFLVNDRLTIIAEVDVLPVNVVPLMSEPLKKVLIASSLSSKEASVKGDSPCHDQVAAQETTDNAASQDKLDNNDDDASEDGTDEDYVPNGSEESSDDDSDYNDDDDSSEESSDDDDDDDDDDASQESLDDDDDDDDDDDEASQDDGDDDDASQEDKDDDESQKDKDDDASSPVVNDDGGSGISPLNQSNALEDLSHKEENHGCTTVVAVAETDQVSNGLDDDALNEDVDNEASSLVLNDNARTESTIDQVLSLEDASQTMKTSVRGPRTLVAVVTETCDNVLMEIQPVKETMDINGFEVVSSKVESVRRIFERHPDIAVEFRAKNQHLRNACMNFLLSLIETMCQSLEELSNEDLVESDIALTYLRDAGFEVDWLEKKLDQLKEKKEEEQSGLARLHEIEENLMILEKKWAELDALADKEKKELKATRSALSFDDLV
ncbi:PREDICTED: kinesin-related protein 4-like [Camelina sativa]|uniref:Kinesin-related protein 4-like n=1 Tax=Camelina sativa TaxID=90675 RepID=A0ABM1RSF0_CAMSA|nr:PREDICTED: kinesin-related protein 4-like [Camelina sativa]